MTGGWTRERRGLMQSEDQARCPSVLEIHITR